MLLLSAGSFYLIYYILLIKTSGRNTLLIESSSYLLQVMGMLLCTWLQASSKYLPKKLQLFCEYVPEMENAKDNGKNSGRNRVDPCNRNRPRCKYVMMMFP
jgi:hypothetical protein